MTNANQPTPPTSRLAAFRRPAASAGAPAGAAGQPAAPEAAPEQGASRGFASRLRDANIVAKARNFNPTGKHRGTITGAKITKSQNGIQVMVQHASEPDVRGSLNFNLFLVKKDGNGAPIMGPDGLPVTQPSVGAWKNWEAFCARYECADAQEVADLIEQGRFAETGIQGIEELWDWSQSGTFYNVSMPLDDPGAGGQQAAA